MTTTGATSIDGLEGEPLSGVAFVQDYVEFHFDGRILRALMRSSVTLNRGTFSFPDEGSRDAYCSLIGRTVTHVDVREGDRIELVFDDRSTLRVFLDPSDGSGLEAAHFVPGKDLPIEVWCSGEVARDSSE